MKTYYESILLISFYDSYLLIYAGIAQLVEHLVAIQKVASSSLVSCFFGPLAQLVRASDS